MGPKWAQITKKVVLPLITLFFSNLISVLEPLINSSFNHGDIILKV